MVMNLHANTGDASVGFNPWVGNITWSRKWKPVPAFLPGKFHEQRSLVGYSSCSCRVDTTERLSRFSDAAKLTLGRVVLF